MGDPRFKTLGVVVATIVAVAGCSGVRGGSQGEAVTSGISSCAAVLPLARASVDGRGVLVKVRRLGKHEMQTLPVIASSSAPSAQPTEKDRRPEPQSCVVAYRGPYRTGEVPSAIDQHGTYALLFLRIRHPVLLRLALVDRLPNGL